jgi:hypothetical protein
MILLGANLPLAFCPFSRNTVIKHLLSRRLLSLFLGTYIRGASLLRCIPLNLSLTVAIGGCTDGRIGALRMKVGK